MKLLRRSRSASTAAQLDDEATMSLMDHLRELRNRLMKCAIAIAVAGVGVFLVYERVYDFGVAPYCEAIQGSKQTNCQLQFLGLADAFLTKMRVSTYLGFLVAMPVIFWQLWRFVAPGLYRKEKRYAIAFVSSSVFLFSLGATLAYITLPAMFRWLIDQGGDALIQPKTEEYFSLLTTMIAAFGFSFEFPLFLLALQVMGVVSPDKLAEVRRFAIVGIVFVVAVVTPGGDPISLFALSIPLILFYEASIWIARAILRRRAA